MVDELDLKILSELVEDARLSYREVARRLRVSPATVLNRVRRLERDGVIKKYSAIVDYSKLGYDLTVITEITVSQGRLVEIEREIAKIGHTCAVYDVTGPTDVIVVARFRSRDELSRFTKSLLAMPYVERTNTHVVLTVVKEDFNPPLKGKPI